MNSKDLKNVLMDCLNFHKRILVTGAAGYGKTTIINETFENWKKSIKVDNGYKRGDHVYNDTKIHVDSTSISDPTDYKGLGFLRDGKAKFLPIGFVNDLENAEKDNILYLVFLDDFGQAVPSVQCAVQALMDKYLNSKHVLFWGSSNRLQDGAGVKMMLNQIKTRFHLIVNFDFSCKCLIEYAIEKNWDSDLIAFLYFSDDTILINDNKFQDLAKGTNPRSIEHFSDLLKFPSTTQNSLKLEIYSSCLHESFARGFIEFQNIIHNLPAFNTIMDNPETVDIPSDISTRLALISLISKKASKDNLLKIITFVKRFILEEMVLCLDLVFSKNPDLKETKAYVDYEMSVKKLKYNIS